MAIKSSLKFGLRCGEHSRFNADFFLVLTAVTSVTFLFTLFASSSSKSFASETNENLYIKRQGVGVYTADILRPVISRRILRYVTDLNMFVFWLCRYTPNIGSLLRISHYAAS